SLPDVILTLERRISHPHPHATIKVYEDDGTADYRARKLLHDHRQFVDQLGTQRLTLALSVWNGMLCHRIYGDRFFALRPRAIWFRSCPVRAEAVGRFDGSRHHQRQDGACPETNLRPDGGAALGDLDGCVRDLRRLLSRISRDAGHR